MVTWWYWAGRQAGPIEVGPDPNSTAQDQIERCVSAAKERSRECGESMGYFSSPWEIYLSISLTRHNMLQTLQRTNVKIPRNFGAASMYT